MKSATDGRFWWSNHSRGLLTKHGIYTIIVFLFGLWGLPLMVDAKCKFRNHTNMTVVNQIYKRLAPIDQKRFPVYDAANKYHYDVGICTAVSDYPSDDDVGATQIEVDSSGHRVKKFIVGKISNVQIMAGTNWVLLEYYDGDSYKSHCNGSSRQATIMIICDENGSSDNPKLRVIEENRNKYSDCYYLFELSHNCVCHKEPFMTVGLSTGSIIVIVFLCAVFAYLVGGFMYMRFVLGAKGYEQIPNYGFWQDFGNLLSDGCNLVCRSGNQGQPKTYKGIGDDQLQDDDDERDEHLLPM